MTLASALHPCGSHNCTVHAYVLQNDQRAIDTADGVVAQARLHGHHPRVYLVSGHGGCRFAACVLGLLCRCAGGGGVVLLYYRRGSVTGGVRPGGGARWVREDVGDAGALCWLSASLMAGDGVGARPYVKATLAARLQLPRFNPATLSLPRATAII